MTTHVDYSSYAGAYKERAEYVPAVIRALLRAAGAGAGDAVCDIGAGSGHLTEPLAAAGLRVDAVEPTAAMRALGERRTAAFADVAWHEGTGEASGRRSGAYRLVTFGSSFDRTDRPAALVECARILAPGGFFACMWNHRDLTDPLQARVEEIIHERVPGYGYGVRRTDQSPVIEASGLFESPLQLSARRVYRLRSQEWVKVWASHYTLGEQAGERFGEVIDAIGALVAREAGEWIDVPYVTRAWLAQRRDQHPDGRHPEGRHPEDLREGIQRPEGPVR